MSSNLQAWEASARYWSRYHCVLAGMFGAITDAITSDGQITDGLQVLDVAGGSGEPSLSLASIVGPTGHVTHTDAIAAMGATASRLAHERGVANVSFVTAPAEKLPFDDASFDRVVCRLGLMFFDDTSQGLREMKRVLRPGGTMCVATWDTSERNPFFEMPLQALSRYVDLGEAFASGALRFDELHAVKDLLVHAGGRGIRARTVPFTMHGPLTFDDWWTMRVDISSTMRAHMPNLSAAESIAVRDAVRESTRSWFAYDGFHIPASVIVAAATF